MSETKLRFAFREPDIDTQRPLVDGSVKVEGFQIEVVPSTTPMSDWDAQDYISTGRVRGVVSGDGLVCIPAFPNRKFRTSYIYVNSEAGIEHPRDLEVKRVAIMYWGNPAAVWAKGAHQNYYGLDLTKINWCAEDPLSVQAPPEFHVEGIPRGSTDAMLADGGLDAAINANVLPSITRRDPRVRRLFDDYKTENQEYWRATHVFPISHIVTLKQEFVDRHPEAPLALMTAYRRARDMAIHRIEGGDPEYLVISWASFIFNEQRRVMGENYWAYNLEDNRPTLEALTQYCHQQGLTPYQVEYRKLFHPEAAAMAGG